MLSLVMFSKDLNCKNSLFKNVSWMVFWLQEEGVALPQ